MRYILDILNVSSPTLIEQALEDWEVVKHSERCFELSGREWERKDMLKLLLALNKGGHVFLFDPHSGQEVYRQKMPQSGRKQQTPPDKDLDVQTLQILTRFQQARQR